MRERSPGPIEWGPMYGGHGGSSVVRRRGTVRSFRATNEVARKLTPQGADRSIRTSIAADGVTFPLR